MFIYHSEKELLALLSNTLLTDIYSEVTHLFRHEIDAENKMAANLADDIFKLIFLTENI